MEEKAALGGAVLNKVSVGGNGVRSVVAFHWLNCDGLSLAGLGEKSSFLLLGSK